MLVDATLFVWCLLNFVFLSCLHTHKIKFYDVKEEQQLYYTYVHTLTYIHTNKMKLKPYVRTVP